MRIYRPSGGSRRIDTSPIRNLSAVGRLDLLRSLYHELVIPPAIELQRNGVDHRRQNWLLLREPTNSGLVKQFELRLDLGEAEAIAIALEAPGDIEK